MTVAQSCIPLERIQLLSSYRRNPSTTLRNQLVELHAGLVRKIAHQFSQQCVEPYEDLEQIGYLGLIRAIERFNPDQGSAFSSFAVPYIRGEILHFLRDNGSMIKIPRRWQELYKEGQKLRKELTITLGRTPTDAEIAQELKVSVVEWQESKLAAQNRVSLSLDATVTQNSECATTLGELLQCPHSNTAIEEERQQLQWAISQLEEKTRKAVEFVFLKELSRKEAAQRIGTSPMTITRYLQRGTEQLMFILQAQAVPAGS